VYYPNAVCTDEILRNGGAELHALFDSEHADCVSYLWFSPVMSFRCTTSPDTFTMHNTVVQKGKDHFEKAVRFRRVSEEESKCSQFFSDSTAPVPLLLFLSLSLLNMPTDAAPPSPFRGTL